MPKCRTAMRCAKSDLFSQAAPMSALGHKQTYAVQKAMSASPLIATAKADLRKLPDIFQPHRLRDLKVVCIGQPTPFRRVSLPVRCWPLAPPRPPELVASTFSWAAVAYHAAALLTPLALTAGLGPALAIAARNKRTTPSVESVTGVIFYSPGQLMTQVGAVTPLAVRPSLFKRQQRD